jgi:hypothetical protein
LINSLSPLPRPFHLAVLYRKIGTHRLTDVEQVSTRFPCSAVSFQLTGVRRRGIGVEMRFGWQTRLTPFVAIWQRSVISATLLVQPLCSLQLREVSGITDEEVAVYLVPCMAFPTHTLPSTHALLRTETVLLQLRGVYYEKRQGLSSIYIASLGSWVLAPVYLLPSSRLCYLMMTAAKAAIYQPIQSCDRLRVLYLEIDVATTA